MTPFMSAVVPVQVVGEVRATVLWKIGPMRCGSSAEGYRRATTPATGLVRGATPSTASRRNGQMHLPMLEYWPFLHPALSSGQHSSAAFRRSRRGPSPLERKAHDLPFQVCGA